MHLYIWYIPYKTGLLEPLKPWELSTSLTLTITTHSSSFSSSTNLYRRQGAHRSSRPWLSGKERIEKAILEYIRLDFPHGLPIGRIYHLGIRYDQAGRTGQSSCLSILLFYDGVSWGKTWLFSEDILMRCCFFIPSEKKLIESIIWNIFVWRETKNSFLKLVSTIDNIDKTYNFRS